MTARLVTALLAVLILAGCSQEEPPSPQRLASPDYPRIVQDQGNSVPLPDGRTLWIFADTAQTEGRPAFFVTSSAAVAARGSLSLRYLTAAGGAPAEFLPRTPPSGPARCPAAATSRSGRPARRRCRTAGCSSPTPSTGRT